MARRGAGGDGGGWWQVVWYDGYFAQAMADVEAGLLDAAFTQGAWFESAFPARMDRFRFLHQVPPHAPTPPCLGPAPCPPRVT